MEHHTSLTFNGRRFVGLRFICMLAFLVVGLSSLLAPAAPAQDAPLWLRYTAISPDGTTILFTYKGDVYSVLAAGGTATPLTMS